MANAASIELHLDAAAFLSRAGSWLERQEVLNHELIALGVEGANGGFTSLPTLWMTTEHDGAVIGAFAYQPAVNLWLAAGTTPRSAAAVSMALRRGRLHPRAVTGPSEAAWAFAESWTDPSRGGSNLDILSLDEVRWPEERMEGELVMITRWNVGVYYAWLADYFREIGRPVTSNLELETNATNEASAGRFYAWKRKDEAHTTILIAGQSTSHGASISIVYTLTPYRGQGYATTAVAALCQRFLDRSASHVALTRDPARMKTSIFERVGFRKAGEAVTYQLRNR